MTSQVISYAKARAEASGLSADGGLIERPDRLVIVLVGAGFTGIGRHFESVADAVYVAMWILAVLQHRHGLPARAGGAQFARSPGCPIAPARTAEAATERSEARPTQVKSATEPISGTPRAGGWCGRCPNGRRGGAVRSTGSASRDRRTRGGEPDQLRRNLARVLGVAPGEVPDELIRASMRSYARYWREAFRLPTMDLGDCGQSPLHRGRAASNIWTGLARGQRRGAGAAAQRQLGHGRSVAGAQRTGTVLTVAERLEPESLFERFVAYRESLGFEIFPLTGGEQPPFPQLAERLRGNKVVCLLGERDLASKVCR